MSLFNFGFVEKSNLTSRPRPSGSASGKREDSDPGDHNVISGTDDGQAAEGEESRLTMRESSLSSNAFHHSVMC